MSSSSITRVYLARHGGTTSSDANRFAGSSNPPLSEAGKAQAAALSERLANTPLAAAYCSDMDRAIETATAVAAPHGIKPVPMSELREISHGHWEGQVHQDVERDFADEYAAWDADPFGYAPAGGETGASVLARALPSMLKMVSEYPGQQLLVVSHTATNRLLLCALMGIDPRRYRDRLGQDLACLNVIDFKNTTNARVITLNDIHHYSDR